MTVILNCECEALRSRVAELERDLASRDATIRNGTNEYDRLERERDEALREVEALRGIYDLVRHHVGIGGSERDRMDALVAIDDIMENGIAADGVRKLVARVEAAENRAETAAHTAAENAALVSRLQRALSFAASVIKSGEPWTTTCDDMISGALTQSPTAALAERDEKQHRESVAMGWALAESEMRTGNFVCSPDSFRAALAEVRAAAWDAAISAGAEACREPRVTHGAELSEFFAGVVLALKGKGPTP